MDTDTERTHIHTFKFRSLRVSLHKWSEPSWKGIDVDVWWRSD